MVAAIGCAAEMKNTHAQKHTDTHRQTHTHSSQNNRAAPHILTRSRCTFFFRFFSSFCERHRGLLSVSCFPSPPRDDFRNFVLNHRDSFPASPLSPHYNQPHSLSKILLEVRCSSVRRIVRHAPRHARLRLRLILQNTHSERAIRRQVNSRFVPSSAA